jgi:hypothetical protein
MATALFIIHGMAKNDIQLECGFAGTALPRQALGYGPNCPLGGFQIFNDGTILASPPPLR